MTFKAIPQALEGEVGIIYRCYIKFLMIFIRKKYSKFRSSPNVESYLHMCKKY